MLDRDIVIIEITAMKTESENVPAYEYENSVELVESDSNIVAVFFEAEKSKIHHNNILGNFLRVQYCEGKEDREQI